MKTWYKFLEHLYKTLNVPGYVWVGIFSLTMLGKLWRGAPISTEALTLYGIVLTNFMVSKAVKTIKGE